MPDVLVIEDDDLVLGLITAALEAQNLSVVGARDGRAGVTLFRRQPTSVVVTDMYLPEMDGIEVLMTLTREFPAVAIIVMSGGGSYGHTSPLAVARLWGAVATFEKPFPVEALVAAVREALETA